MQIERQQEFNASFGLLRKAFKRAG